MSKSIRVNDFQWNPGKNDVKYIKLLESSRDEWQKIAQKAITKLKTLSKAQEPRVMTLEEVNVLDWDYCYLEQERLPGKEYRGMLGKHIMTCVTWPSITAAEISSGAENYGRTWRCWASRPTEEQREATPWAT